MATEGVRCAIAAFPARGTILLLLARGCFLVSGYIISVILARGLGTGGVWGVWGHHHIAFAKTGGPLFLDRSLERYWRRCLSLCPTAAWAPQAACAADLGPCQWTPKSGAVTPRHLWEADAGCILASVCPELNVVDRCWGPTKYGELAPSIPHDVGDLAQEVAHSLLTKHDRRDLLGTPFSAMLAWSGETSHLCVQRSIRQWWRQPN